jgi:hypothetical protein
MADVKNIPIEGQSHRCDGRALGRLPGLFRPCDNVVRDDSDRCAAGHPNKIRVGQSPISTDNTPSGTVAPSVFSYETHDLVASPTAPKGKLFGTYEEALHHAKCYVQVRDTVVTHDEIASVMFNEQVCTWHAAHVVFQAAYNDGRIPTDVCALCGGRNDAGHGDHELCKTRAARGVECLKLDVVDEMRCACADCQAKRVTDASELLRSQMSFS